MRSRRPFILLALAALLLGACATTSAATPPAGADAGVVLLVRTERHLQVALKTAADLRAAHPREVHVLVCGDAVTALRRGAPLEPALEAAKAQGTRVVACGLSLTDKQVDPAELSPHVDQVPNALVEAVHLQDRGFRSIEL